MPLLLSTPPRDVREEKAHLSESEDQATTSNIRYRLPQKCRWRVGWLIDASGGGRPPACRLWQHPVAVIVIAVMAELITCVNFTDFAKYFSD